MNSPAIRTRAIVLSRTDYGEADRILTVLTPDHGKVSLIAKGVRRLKSKLAGGIELFSVSDISYLKGRRDLGTLVSSQLTEHFGNIVSDIDRVQLGYTLIKQLHRATEEEVDQDYFELLRNAFLALNDNEIKIDLIRLWFTAQLLRLNGHTPNLQTDLSGEKLVTGQKYTFDFENVSFAQQGNGNYSTDSIKVLRLFFSELDAAKIHRVSGVENQLKQIQPLILAMQNSYTTL